MLAPAHLESIPGFGQSVDFDPGSDRELELAGISLQIVGGLVLGRIRGGRSRKRHPRQSVVTARRKQTQRIPPLPPGIADPVVLVQDHERQAVLLEVIADSQTCLASADDHGSELLIAHSATAYRGVNSRLL